MKSYTVKLLLSLLLLLGANNAKAYCYATQWENGIPVYSSLGVAYGTTLQSCQQLACEIFPQIPECGQPPPPPCNDIVEFQSVACEPNYSGAINQTRTKTCSNNQWTDWTTTSNNCSPNPPTCQTSVEERQVACSDGYTGSISEQRSSSCPDPYGQPIFGQWVEISNSCVKSVTNPTNVSSPVNPASPIAPPPPPQEAPPPPPAPPPMEAMPPEMPKAEMPKAEAPKAEAPKPQSSGSASTSSSPTAANTETKETKTDTKIDVPKGKDLVPGFGLVMSLEILNAPIVFQQQQLEIVLNYTQELDSGTRNQQGFLHGLLMEGNSDNFYNIINGRWNALRSSIEVQPDF